MPFLESRNVAMKLAVVVTLLNRIPLYLKRTERNTENYDMVCSSLMRLESFPSTYDSELTCGNLSMLLCLNRS